jgi:hypothetical protein
MEKLIVAMFLFKISIWRITLGQVINGSFVHVILIIVGDVGEDVVVME